MARWENENVSGLNLPDETKTSTEYYNRHGKTCSEKASVTKIVTTTTDKTSIRYYIKFSRGEFIDPHAIDQNYSSSTSVFKRVKEDVYFMYVKYIESKNRLYFTRARRKYMET